MKHIKFLFSVFVVFGVVVLLVQNHEAFNTKVVLKANFLIDNYESTEISLYLISSIAFILGVIITWVYNLLERFQLKRQISALKNEAKEKDKELNSLRNLPITTDNVTPAIHEHDVLMA